MLFIRLAIKQLPFLLLLWEISADNTALRHREHPKYYQVDYAPGGDVASLRLGGTSQTDNGQFGSSVTIPNNHPPTTRALLTKKQKRNRKKRRKKKKKKKKKKTPAPTPAPTPEPICSDDVDAATDMVSLRSLFVNLGVSQADVLEDNTTPQFKALKWLTMDTIVSSAGECRLVQRYAVATLLYATGNEGRITSSSECGWWKHGFVCNRDQRLIHIRVGKDLIRSNTNIILKRSSLTHTRSPI
jgi:hypothetical protein